MGNGTNIQELQKGDIVILRVKGKLDSTLSCALEKSAYKSTNLEVSKLILNLGEVNYINSSGLRMLLAVKKHIKTIGGKLIVCALKNEILEVMKVCGFDHVLEIARDEEEALQQF